LIDWLTTWPNNPMVDRPIAGVVRLLPQIEVVAGNDEDFRAWEGWVESRLRQLVMRVERLVSVRPWPKALFPPNQGDEPPCAYYYMGLKKKLVRATGGTPVFSAGPAAVCCAGDAQELTSSLLAWAPLSVSQSVGQSVSKTQG
jgi:Poly(A) polymerase predicted RNA binding domain